MLPFWIGFNTQALIQFNSAWLESTAGLLTLLAWYADSGGPFGCRDCIRPMDRVHSIAAGRDYYRCRHCGLIKLPSEAREPSPHGPDLNSPRRVITLGSRRAALKSSLGQTLH